MKAIVHDSYGSPDTLELREIDTRVPKNNEVLVRVRAAGVHVGDCFTVRGAPLPLRLVTGLLKPKCGVPGFDVAGHVEAVGSEVTRFQVGDEVFGVCRTGACAEYACVREDRLAPKPAGLTFEQAAAVPTSAATALHALREVGESLGAHHVIDHTREDFTSGERRYDLILDNVENHSLAACRRVLTPAGTLPLIRDPPR
jgi:NADPH:quinone reductase-like Zn-dependent oxidoreductase